MKWFLFWELHFKTSHIMGPETRHTVVFLMTRPISAEIRNVISDKSDKFKALDPKLMRNNWNTDIMYIYIDVRQNDFCLLHTV